MTRATSQAANRALTGGCAVVLLAGGSGTRMQQAENKVYLPVGGRTMLGWSLEVFERSPLVGPVVLVVREGDEDRAATTIERVGARKLVAIVRGGDTRHESELAGLEALADPITAGEVDLVCIHDAARPFVTQDLLRRIVETAARVGGAVPGLPLDAGFLLRTDGGDSRPVPVPTHDLRRVQTPQAFDAQALLEAYRRASEAGFNGADTAESMERFSDVEVEIVAGDPANVKLTYLDDLAVAEELARAWAGSER